MIIVNGRLIAEKILKKISKKKGKKHSLSVFMIGNYPASESFIKQKEKAAKMAKINFKLIRLSPAISQKKLTAAIKKESKKNPSIVQLPLPKKFKTAKILNSINPKNDADCLTDQCLTDIVSKPRLLPPTVLALKKVLGKHDINLKNKKIAVVGIGRLVGLPIFLWLMDQKAEIIVCDKRTKNIFLITRKADVIVSGTGKANFIKGRDIKNGSVLIDYGFSKIRNSDGSSKIAGDFNFESCAKKASVITPVPGGMGPITVACLMENVSKID